MVADMCRVRPLDPLLYPISVYAFDPEQRIAVKAQTPRDRPPHVGPQRNPFNTNDGVRQIWQRHSSEERPKEGGRRNEAPNHVAAGRRERIANENRRSTPNPPAKNRSRRALSGDAMQAAPSPRPLISRSSSSHVKIIL